MKKKQYTRPVMWAIPIVEPQLLAGSGNSENWDIGDGTGEHDVTKGGIAVPGVDDDDPSVFGKRNKYGWYVFDDEDEY